MALLSYVATCQGNNILGVLLCLSSSKPFLIRAFYTPSTDPVHERSSPFLLPPLLWQKQGRDAFPI